MRVLNAQIPISFLRFLMSTPGVSWQLWFEKALSIPDRPALRPAEHDVRGAFPLACRLLFTNAR